MDPLAQFHWLQQYGFAGDPSSSSAPPPVASAPPEFAPLPVPLPPGQHSQFSPYPVPLPAPPAVPLEQPLYPLPYPHEYSSREYPGHLNGRPEPANALTANTAATTTAQVNATATDPSHPDLYALRSLQRQRKREFSATAYTQPVALRQDNAHSTLLGYAGTESSTSPAADAIATSPFATSFASYHPPPPHHQDQSHQALRHLAESVAPMPPTSSAVWFTPLATQFGQLDHSRDHRAPRLAAQSSSVIAPHTLNPDAIHTHLDPAAINLFPSSRSSNLSASLTSPRTTSLAGEPPTDDPTSVTSPDLLPILEQGLKIRLQHLQAPPALSTHPARDRNKHLRKGSSRKTAREARAANDDEELSSLRQSCRDLGSNPNDPETTYQSVKPWKIGKNHSGKINSLELFVDCQQPHCLARRIRHGSSSSNFERDSIAQYDRDRPLRVSKLILRNFSPELLDGLKRINAELEQLRTPEPGASNVRKVRNRTTTAGSSSSTSTTATGTRSHSRSSTSVQSTPTILPIPTFAPNHVTPPTEPWTNRYESDDVPRAELGIEVVGTQCLACAGFKPTQEPEPPQTDGDSQSRSSTTTGAASGDQVRERGYEDTLSAAIDKFQALSLSPSTHLNNDLGPEPSQAETRVEEEEDWKRLVHVEETEIPKEFKAEILKCDGSGQGVSGKPFTVEVICARCDALFQACSDCGSGGGRLTPGRWRCKELFPAGRKNCQLSHARNPTLKEISVVISPVSSLSPTELDQASAACRKLFFNTRLGTLARPDFMLKGDGLANTFKQAENLSIDYWGRLNEVLYTVSPPDSLMKRYLVITYSQPRPRHPTKPVPASSVSTTHIKAEETDDDFDPTGTHDRAHASLKQRAPKRPSTGGASTSNSVNLFENESTREGKKVPWAFSIIEVDFSVGVLFFCCLIPWATSGQSFDANSLLIERTNARIKHDLSIVNIDRIARGLSPLPRLKYNFIVSPFRLDSKNSQNLNRRGYYTLDQMEEMDEEGIDRTLFPPYREIWLPAHYGKASVVFVRKLENEEDLGGPPIENAPRKRKKKIS
ncbi:uncharacterized protein JCM15063_004538 [Sporobolomyces koalae]|uniref:uncharacterized protein n=1 Tax=Sporobolomyces koalae TaxID=500713 RepID=UPI00316DC73F